METFYFSYFYSFNTSMCPSSWVKDACAFATSGAHTPAEHWASASRDLSARRGKATDGERERREKDCLICCKNVNTWNKKNQHLHQSESYVSEVLRIHILTS